MNMTSRQISAAYRAILELTGIVLPYAPSRGVMDLKKRLEAENDTVVAMEKNLVVEYGGEVHPGGQCDFSDTDTAQRFREALEEARDQADDIKLPTVDLSKYTNLIRISPAAIEALEGIVIFEKEPQKRHEGWSGPELEEC